MAWQPARACSWALPAARWLRRGHGGEPLGERHDEQEGEEHLHPRYSNPKLVEQLEEFAVELLVAVFIGLGVTPRVTTSVFRVHTPDNLLHRLRVHNGPTLSTDEHDVTRRSLAHPQG